MIPITLWLRSRIAIFILMWVPAAHAAADYPEFLHQYTDSLPATWYRTPNTEKFERHLDAFVHYLHEDSELFSGAIWWLIEATRSPFPAHQESAWARITSAVLLSKDASLQTRMIRQMSETSRWAQFTLSTPTVIPRLRILSTMVGADDNVRILQIHAFTSALENTQLKPIRKRVLEAYARLSESWRPAGEVNAVVKWVFLTEVYYSVPWSELSYKTALLAMSDVIRKLVLSGPGSPNLQGELQNRYFSVLGQMIRSPIPEISNAGLLAAFAVFRADELPSEALTRFINTVFNAQEISIPTPILALQRARILARLNLTNISGTLRIKLLKNILQLPGSAYASARQIAAEVLCRVDLCPSNFAAQSGQIEAIRIFLAHPEKVDRGTTERALETLRTLSAESANLQADAIEALGRIASHPDPVYAQKAWEILRDIAWTSEITGTPVIKILDLCARFPWRSAGMLPMQPIVLEIVERYSGLRSLRQSWSSPLFSEQLEAVFKKAKSSLDPDVRVRAGELANSRSEAISWILQVECNYSLHGP